MTTQKMLDFWMLSASRDDKTINTLYKAHEYHWALFFWQLKLEKLFKAVLTKQKKEIPFSHNLVLLIRKIELELSPTDKSELNEISTFNLEARYDDYKFTFYKKATKMYTDKWIAICKKWEKRAKELL